MLGVSYAAAVKALEKASSILVTTHLNPDGDGLGSGLALLHAFDALKKKTRFICPSPVASLYSFLPGFKRIEPITDEGKAKALPKHDVVISCDCGDRNRLGVAVSAPRGTLINLDHHATNGRFGDINLVDEKAESSGVVVANLLKRMHVPMDKILAECLYATIVYDTGRFMHSNTTAHTFRWTATLLQSGIDAATINRKLTYTKSLHDLKITALGIERLSVDDKNNRLAGIALSANDIAKIGEPEDWGDLVDVPRSLAGNCIAYLFRESKDKKTVRCSLRSNPPYLVSPVAEAFGGGGHLQAAGATFPGNLAEAVKELVPRLRRQLAAH
jgi:phosphoesterase RecJ-like protein